MDSSHIRSVQPLVNLDRDSDDSNGGGDRDSLLGSIVGLLEMARVAPRRSSFKSTDTLRLLSFTGHSTLVAIHVALLAVWSWGLEHNLVFSLESQSIASFVMTAIVTTFGTVYSALLVFISQTLAMRRSLQMDQTLTATHDTTAAWAGVASAAFNIWQQRAVLASFTGVLSAFLYLGNILLLHITISSLFSLATFESYREVPVRTQGLPAYNWPHNFTAYSWDHNLRHVIAPMREYASGALYLLPSIIRSHTTLGLHEGTLYDVLDRTDFSAKGNATVNATGFNITCGFIPDAGLSVRGTLAKWPEVSRWFVTLNEHTIDVIRPTQPGIIVMLRAWQQSVVLYSTIPIIDSRDNHAPLVSVTPPMETSVSSVHIIRCSQSLVNQTAIVDAQTRQIIAVDNDIKKNSSAWLAYADPPGTTFPPDPNNTMSGNFFIDQWAEWYWAMPPSNFPRNVPIDWGTNDDFISVAEQYLIEKLNLRPANQGYPPSNVTLHELENALSIVSASMFWTRHIPPVQGAFQESYVKNPPYQFTTVREVQNAPYLLQGHATVTEVFNQVHLELSIIAIASGLAVSIALMLLSLPYSRYRVIKEPNDVKIDGTGLLHAIWLYRNHPELERLLEQVEYPTDESLREAGMVRTRLAAGQHVHRYRRFQLFEMVDM
ncbi:hypothetical protein MVEN_00330100 [Mycena venus]|uniref:Uncharacterized protein n=1 Tax=Mycena venus TaxID=2733690 RepID=A0A8H6YTY9_9AGAR|nr:hypothetical protein MVEN_00330100 [Mycena venus]